MRRGIVAGNSRTRRGLFPFELDLSRRQLSLDMPCCQMSLGLAKQHHFENGPAHDDEHNHDSRDENPKESQERSSSP